MQYIDTTHVANILGIARRTLERWRVEGKGPIYHRFGGRVVYSELDLITWADQQRHTSTSDGGVSHVYPD